MAASSDAKNLMLDALLQGATLNVSLHTADPGVTGANEVAGGSYSRVVCTFAAASGGQSSNTQQLVWTDLPACLVTHCGVWRGTTFLFGAALTQARTLSAGDGFFFRPATVTVQVS
ncbi:MAG: hypothetical protein KatS3mg005_3429 [Bryobacteraceae bacterium]|nr:MAG: hypothetical protein KatS3mg005_3429 [Bryobacteraceae bacterium]